MEELIRLSKDMLEGHKAEYERLQEAFNAETDMKKKDDIDTQIGQVNKDIFALERQVLALEVAAKKSAFDPSRLGPLAKSIADHSQETSRAIKEYSDSVEKAKYLASRVTSGAKLIGNILKTIA